MKCAFCGGKVVSESVTFSYENNEQMIVVRNVPAEICRHCGEKTYSPEITDELLKFAKKHFKPLKVIEVPIFDYTDKMLMAS